MVNELEQLGFSAELRELMLQLLSRDPEKRPNFTEILAADWFSGRVEEQLSTEPDIE